MQSIKLLRDLKNPQKCIGCDVIVGMETPQQANVTVKQMWEFF